MDEFEFNALTFVSSTEEQDVDHYYVTLHETGTIHQHYPELAHWSRFAFFVAWGTYSQDIYAVNWIDWLNGQRDEGFLAYCYVCQRWSSFIFSGSKRCNEDFQLLGATHPWAKTPLPAKPEWVTF